MFIVGKKPSDTPFLLPFLLNNFQVIPGVEITVGQDKDDGGRWPYAGTAIAVEEMGAKHVNRDVLISFCQILQANSQSCFLYSMPFTLHSPL